MSTQKCAPCPARSTLGDHANAQCFDSSTCATPAPAAERSIEPTLPGSCTSSSSRQKSAGAAFVGVGVVTTASRPTPAGSVASSPKSDAGTTSVRSACRSASAPNCRARQRVVGHDQRLGCTVSRGVDCDQVLAFEHAPARLAPVARRGDQPRRLAQSRIVPRSDVAARWNAAGNDCARPSSACPGGAQRLAADAGCRSDRQRCGVARGWRSPVPRPPSRAARSLAELEEDLVLPHHAELRARALLDRLVAALEVAHVGVERIVARLQPRVSIPLRRELPVELAHLQPAALAEPHRILQRGDQRDEGESEPAQGGATSAGRRPRGPDSSPLRRGPPRCAAAGCTSRCGPSATAIRS